MKNAKNLMMMLVLVMTFAVMSCDEKQNEEMAPEEQTTVDGASRLRQVSSETLDTSGMDNWSMVDMVDLPQAAQDYLNANYDGIGIAEGYQTESGEFVLLLDNDIVVIFNTAGEKLLEFDLGDLLEDDEGWDEIPLDNLPQAILDYVATNYPNSSIEEAARCPENDHIIIFLDTDEALEFGKDGSFIGVFDEDEEWDDEDYREIPADSLLQPIKDYLAANYAGTSVIEAIFDLEEEEYYVELDTEVILIFDKDGNFLELWDDEDYTEVAIEDLPQPIKDYIAVNYADRTIEGAYYDSEEEEYLIELDDDRLLIFDKDGNFIEVDENEEFTDIKIEDLPQAIKDYIAKNYAGRTIDSAEYDTTEELYHVELDDELVLVFDKDGKYLTEYRDD